MIEIPKLPNEIRASLPLVVQAYIAALEALEAVVAELQSQIEALQAQISELQALIRQNSGNSSRPPSSDPPATPPRPKRKPSGRKQGGQPGHERHVRPLLPSDEVDEIVDHHPEQCPQCHARLAADLPAAKAFERQQVWDIPPVKPTVTEHRYHSVECPGCHTLVAGQRPADVPPGAFGPAVIAVVGLLHGRYRLSMRETEALLADVFQLPISTGGVSAVCQVVSASLATAYADSHRRVSAAKAANVDETGWKQAGQKLWLWVAVTAEATVFRLADRSAKALKALLGESYTGITTSDRFKSYWALPLERRQACWAHLKRNWQAFSERDGPVGEWGQTGITQIESLFEVWHQYKDGALARAALRTEMQAVQNALHELLEQGRGLPLKKAQTFCRDLLALWPTLWKFLEVEGIEPTNNAAERALRPAVLWRKGCFGTQSETGNHFVIRILTVVATCRQQKRHVLTFLTDAVKAYIAGQPTPALFSTP